MPARHGFVPRCILPRRGLFLFGAALVPTAVQGAALGPTWEVDVGLRQRADSDLAAAGGVSRFRSELGGGLALNHAGSRLRAAIAGRATALFYTDLVSADRIRPDRVDYSGSLDGSFAASPRLQLGFTGGLATSLVQEAAALGPEAGRLGTGSVRTSAAQGRLEYHRSPATVLHGRLFGSRTWFDSAQLAGGWTLGIAGGARHALGERDSLATSLLAERSSLPGQTLHTLAASIDWTHRRSSRLGFAVSAGPGLSRTRHRLFFTPYGAVSVTTGLGNGQLRGRYSRGAAAGFGLGRARITHDLIINYGKLLARNLALATEVAARRSGDPLDPSFRVESVSAGGTLSYEVNRRLRLSGEYQFRDGSVRGASPAGAVPARPNHRLGFELSFREGWR